jgi:leader peptidase (prepilin peptidase) / N-methyltransferase
MLIILKIIFGFVLGSIMGSFLLVAATRFGVKSLQGRSRCDSCGTTIAWYDLVPVVSYLRLGGRCRSCECKISSWNFWVELVTACSFAVHTIVATDMVTLVVGYIVLSLCVVLVIYDSRSMWLPSEVLWALIGVGVVYRFLSYYELGIVHTVEGLLYMLIPAFLLFAIAVLSRGRAMGIGDPVLLLGLSLVIGSWQGALLTLLFASWFGLLYVIARYLQQSLVSKKQEKILGTKIPFGPALVAGFIVAWWVSLLGWFILV